MSQEKIDVLIEFPCPSCGLACGAGYDDNDTPTVIHAVPHCQYFIETDVVQIVQDANSKKKN